MLIKYISLEESQYRGEAFERQIAYILQDAGFEIESLRPHEVIRGGTKIGDIDIIARDPISGERVAVSCKEWFRTSPGSTAFAKFIIMLQMEGFTTGILASASRFKKSVAHMLEEYKEHGYTIGLLDATDTDRLHRYKIEGDTKAIRRMIRNMLHLPLEAPKAPELPPPPEPHPTSTRDVVSNFLGSVLAPSEESKEEEAAESVPFILRAHEELVQALVDSDCLMMAEVKNEDGEAEEEEDEIGNEVYLTNQRLIIVNRESGLFSEKVEVALEVPLKGIQTVNQMTRGLLSKTIYLTIPIRKGRGKSALAFSVESQALANDWHNTIEKIIQSG